MSRYNKTFTVRAVEGGIEVFFEGKILYKYPAGTWRQQLLEWQRTGWEIIWTA